ncbi:hypothetical protein GS634_19755 [Ruegeria atlantica]|jgi:hypothetical protein|uniref:Secreted protein n=1 Tax=Ruegeria atlantica TaxID=81569 RepID=A0AA91C0Q1_9RHOB|nr:MULTISPECIES: hypothetical protein [Ruegeria]NOC85469.1 hypothetical protein [Ruegeria sp. HKCCD6428]NOC93981.1 hypothetical protein [Ruegeria sp. HKCCD6604]NOE20366.1 hypothetical protein [Ruegeria atlantica]
MRYVILSALLAVPALADPPTIEQVRASATGDTWRFDVTIRHPDTGWDHYADGWRVLDMDGNELGLRVLHHPHETEQPFTRSLGGVVIPENVSQVQIQARCNVDGWNADTTLVELN